jgi:hypothetical protein
VQQPGCVVTPERADPEAQVDQQQRGARRGIGKPFAFSGQAGAAAWRTAASTAKSSTVASGCSTLIM